MSTLAIMMALTIDDIAIRAAPILLCTEDVVPLLISNATRLGYHRYRQ